MCGVSTTWSNIRGHDDAVVCVYFVQWTLVSGALFTLLIACVSLLRLYNVLYNIPFNAPTSHKPYRRGLNPPHRLKSISMTTFTDAEIESLRGGGNEVSD